MIVLRYALPGSFDPNKPHYISYVKLVSNSISTTVVLLLYIIIRH